MSPPTVADFGILSAFAAPQAYSPIPVIYVEGQGHPIYAVSNDKSSETLYPPVIEDGYILDKATGLISPLIKGIVSDDWTEYCDAIYNAASPIFVKNALDKNGEATNGTGLDCKKDKNITDRKTSQGYNVKSYTFTYDWRLDPCVLADELHEYIEEVKKVTNSDKVDIISRCIGCQILLAYMYEYGAESFNNCIFYCGGFYGFEVVGAPFAGELSLDADALVRYVNYMLSGDEYADNELISFIKSTLNIANAASGLNLGLDAIEAIYDKVYEQVLPRLIVDLYATMPSFWSMVGDDYYDSAKQLIFGGKENEYAGLISKIDYFHDNVYANAEKLLTEARESGVKVSIVAKYGHQITPVVKDADVLSDGITSVPSASFGATCATVDGVLDKEYISALEASGNDKFLSPDLQIDASSCLFPENTWFIKNVGHKNMPDCIEALFDAMYNFDGYMTVFDNENYPQYLVCNDEGTEMRPLDESDGTGNYHFNSNLSEHFYNFMRIFLKYVTEFFRSLFDGILQIVDTAQGNQAA